MNYEVGSGEWGVGKLSPQNPPQRARSDPPIS